MTGRNEKAPRGEPARLEMLGTLECKSLVRLDFPGHCRINAVAIKTIFFCDDSRMILARFAGRQASGDDFLGT
ncbi:hypothetical protein, partial [Staphylococcus aureus]